MAYIGASAAHQVLRGSYGQAKCVRSARVARQRACPRATAASNGHFDSTERHDCPAPSHSEARKAYFDELTINWQQLGEIVDPRYLPEEHETWNTLFDRATKLHYGGFAAPEFLECLDAVNYRAYAGVPSHKETSEMLYRDAGWQLAPVEGSISGRRFQTLLSQKHMPTTMYVRPREELDFTPMPDCFHELVGHAPIVLNPEMRMLHEAFGQALVRSNKKHERIAIFAVFFALCEAGLIRNRKTGKAQAIGASVLTGNAELLHCVTATDKHRRFSIPDVLASASLNEGGFKPVYFVGDSVSAAVESCLEFLDDPARFVAETSKVSGNASDRE
mmetsp:Transcript_395/g.1342  ORF Transcript_395/g.1342 Transcript_395/m.1342 type:complete len:332 (-) Transcript_395:88-1083(-)